MTLSRQWDNRSIIIEMQLRGKFEQCSSANRIATVLSAIRCLSDVKFSEN